MKRYASVTVVLTILMVAIFWPSSKPIVDPIDFEQYLISSHLEKSKEKSAAQINFWQAKLKSAPNNFVYKKKLAGLLANDFRLSGNIDNLHRSDELLRSVNDRIPGQVGVLQSLAANAITRHAFREAEEYLTEALAFGEKKFSTSLMLADVKMERGNMYSARFILEDIASTEHFDYLVRAMKFQDQKGDLAAAIASMEKAAEQAEEMNAPGLVNWSFSNLGDMYGHDGRIRKSYETYLKALSYNPADLHSLRGIAWIAFSHDKNLEEAKKILTFLKRIHPVPDYNLLLAEIAQYEGDSTTAAKYTTAFIAQANQPVYGNMYQSYLCEMKCQTPEAMAIAEAEVEERPHPMSYSLLAWSKLQNGSPETALETVENHVLHRTGEPVALYHAGVIFAENNMPEQAKKYLKEALDAGFELGPVITEEIEGRLKQL